MASDDADDAASAVMHTVSERFSYVFDWAGLYRISAEEPESGSVVSLRGLALPTGFATHANVPGHYLVNTASDLDAECIQLPALIEFQDPSAADCLAIGFVLAKNGKLYLAALDLPLNHGKDKSGKETWVDDSKAMKTVKLDVVKSFKAVENRDGCALGKIVDQFMHQQSHNFKPVQIRSMLDARQWCSAGRFFSNLSMVMASTDMRIRKKYAPSSSGGKKGATQKNPQKVAEEKELEAKLKELANVRAALEADAKFYNTPLGSRLLSAPLDPLEEGKTLDLSGLESVIKRDSLHYSSELMEFLKLAEKMELLASGKADTLPFGTPLKPRAQKRAAAAQAADEPKTSAAPKPQTVEAAAAPESAADSAGNPAKQRPPKRSCTWKEAKEQKKEALKTAKRGPRNVPSSPIEIDESQEEDDGKDDDAADIESEMKKDNEVKPKRKYVKSGLFSKNPEVAALARSKTGLVTPSCRATASTASDKGSSSGGGSSSNALLKYKDTIADLKMSLAQRDAKIENLERELQLEKKSKLDVEKFMELEVQKKELDTKLSMNKLIDEAYDKGYDRAMKSMEEMKRLMSSSHK